MVTNIRRLLLRPRCPLFRVLTLGAVSRLLLPLPFPSFILYCLESCFPSSCSLFFRFRIPFRSFCPHYPQLFLIGFLQLTCFCILPSCSSLKIFMVVGRR